ncbi:hypothetical protein K504DRAFT_398700 [Pleomassaria siparia CBS 279.74]|uniref:Rhodopsin domain-containing protein n=1 Tax=Pleomassaria siparia CBS 279.74 TaxID=1314801 RepID=A0A6G1KM54_9PLEO|nr:hypothetical protein K504DRAFT_398700 [Pleomassaria siparia CBS 279.74]
MSSESIGWQLQWFTGFFVPLQIIAVALRFYARQMVLGAHFVFEDALVFVSLILQLALAGVGIGSVYHGGVGHHLEYLEENEPQKVLTWGKYLLTLATLYFVTVMVPKIAVLALYKRIFPARSVQIIIYLLGGILIGGAIANVVTSLAACKPFKANYNPTLPGAKCIDKEAFYVWTSVPNIITDVIMLVLPLPIVWNLHNTKRIKVALTFTFLVGSFGLVASILRFHTFFVTNSFTDGTYDAVELIIWTLAEPGIYLISACLMTYRPLVERVTRSRAFGGLKGSLHVSSQRMGIGNGAGREGESGERSLPLKSLNKSGRGFTELTDEESVEVIRTSSDGGRPRQEDGIVVTTEIQNSWSRS